MSNSTAQTEQDNQDNASAFDIHSLNISYEFFPPKTEKGSNQFWQAIRDTDHALDLPKPKFHSITYGALGSDRTRSIDTVIECSAQLRAPIAAHITSAGQSKKEALETVEKWYAKGVERLVVLRGDADTHADGFKDAIELIKAVKKIGDFDISVAAYPEVHPKATSREADLDVLQAKLEAGAHRAITQFFFEPGPFLKLRNDMIERGIEQPLVAGILPIQNFAKVVDFSQRCGTAVPEYVHKLFEPAIGDIAKEKQIGIDLATFLCADLIGEGVSDFHFYTLNTGHASRAVVSNLNTRAGKNAKIKAA